MAELVRIMIYPVKALEPVFLKQARILKSGALEGDRSFGMFDADGKFLNGKRNPLVHHLRSSFNPLSRELKLGRAERGLETSFHIERQLPALEGWLTEFFGQPVTFRKNTDVGFPDDLDCPGPTVISTGSLREVASWFPPLDIGQMRLRIRANLEIAGVPPFWEDRLYGVKGTRVRFRIGDCLFDGNNPCQRCAVPPRDPFTGENNPQFPKIFAQRREETLPPWAERSRFNHFYRLSVNTVVPPDQTGKSVTVGDTVTIIGEVS